MSFFTRRLLDGVQHGSHRRRVHRTHCCNYPAVAAGVEEVATIRAAHALDPSRATAVLLEAPGVEWATSFDDPARADWHARKMSSKEARPAVHLEPMGGTKGATVLPRALLNTECVFSTGAGVQGVGRRRRVARLRTQISSSTAPST